MSINRKVKTTESMSSVKMLCHSNCMKSGLMSGGMPMTPFKCVCPIGIPMSVVTKMPMSMAPFTL